MAKNTKTMRVGVVGYGGAFNMGKQHLDLLTSNEGFEAGAVCDPDSARLDVAKADFPNIDTYSSLDDMIKNGSIDLAIIITPHNLHAEQVLQCLNAGIHVVCEKPLAITGDEVMAMLEAAKANNVMLSTYHNRRWDGDFVALRKIVREGLIGKVFRVEAGHTGYREQGTWWRSNRAISGGAIYDWGAHFTDWILNLVDDQVEEVSGFQVKNPLWKTYTNEDHSEATIRFKNNCLATLTISNLSMNPRPRWRVLGDQGSIVDAGGHFEVNVWVKGRQMTTTVQYDAPDAHAYYKNVAGHLRDGEDLVITGESAARVIAVLHAANLSAHDGGKPVVPVLQ